jgi:glutamyl/glutaminyl-tRNA synthetase
LYLHALPFLKGTEFESLPSEKLEPLLEAVRQSLRRLDELPAKLAVFTHTRPEMEAEARSYLQPETAAMLLRLIVQSWQSMPEADAERLLGVVREIGKSAGIKGKDLWMPLRAALTGRTGGPELKIVIAHLGATEATARLYLAIEKS